MSNNAELGMTIQKMICDKFLLTPHPRAISQFAASYNPSYKDALIGVIDDIFDEINANPIQCTTFSPSGCSAELCPHNFILDNERTLSIRTNMNGDKIAPRVVGQAGINTFNEHFSDIAGYEVKEKEEIKEVVYKNIHTMLPIFLDYFFISDYTVWVHLTRNNEYKYVIIDKNSFVDIGLERKNFCFTRNLVTWNESTTLLYKGRSLAEIQIHKNRTFKFRFIMNALMDMLVEHKSTTETFGITAEKVICDIFDLPTPLAYRGRYNILLAQKISPIIKEAFKRLPRAIKSTGAESGIRGKNSKCPYDFVLDGNETLSLKTNTGKMICPPEVGQPGAATCYFYFHDYIVGDKVTAETFKKMVYSHIADIIPIYIQHLFEADYLLWIYKTGNLYKYKVFDSNFANRAIWKPENFEFSKPTLEEWNESNTVKYLGLPIGEFQVHTNRSCYKFRFNMINLEFLIKTQFY